MRKRENTLTFPRGLSLTRVHLPRKPARLAPRQAPLSEETPRPEYPRVLCVRDPD